MRGIGKHFKVASRINDPNMRQLALSPRSVPSISLPQLCQKKKGGGVGGDSPAAFSFGPGSVGENNGESISLWQAASLCGDEIGGNCRAARLEKLQFKCLGS